MLRSGGAWTINWSTPSQIIDGYWWMDWDIFPKGCAAYQNRTPSMEVFQKYLRDAGFEVRNDSVVNMQEATLMAPDIYHADKYNKAFAKIKNVVQN